MGRTPGPSAPGQPSPRRLLGAANPGAVPRGQGRRARVGRNPRAMGPGSVDPHCSAHSKVTDTTFESDPEAPLASVTVTVIVKLRGRTMMLVCPALNEPSLETLPLDVEPSPQSIAYDHGPLWLPSLKLHVNE